MKTNLVVLSVFMAVSLLFTASGLADCGMCSAGQAKSDDEGSLVKDQAINTVCPVMGVKISKDTPYFVEYKGNKIGLCCESCVKTFKSNPDKYGQKVLDEQK